MGRHSRRAEPATTQAGRSRHRGPGRGRSWRFALLAASAVITVGAIAVTSGLLAGVTGGVSYEGDAKGIGPDAPPAPARTGSDLPSTLGGHTGTPSPSRSSARSARPATRPPTHPPAPRPTASRTHSPAPTGTTAAPKPAPTPAPVRTTAPAPTARPTRGTTSAGSAVTAARAAVLSLVNDARATAGCAPLAADPSLTLLAQSFSDDMAARGFFDHTDPDGRTPWDRAARPGVTDLGGENIARGQDDPQAVMDSWMNSPGHRANILNCSYKTLGVGVHFGPGGPWWTQDFGT